MKKENLTFEQKQRLVQMFKGTLHLSTVAKELKISKSLLTLIITGERKDHYKAIEKCFNDINTIIIEFKSIINCIEKTTIDSNF